MERTPSYLPIAVRAWTERRRPEDDPEDVAAGRWAFQPLRLEHVLVFDTETTVDPSQRLLFGCWRYYRVEGDPAVPKLQCVEEGLVHGDDLPKRDKVAFRVLQEYVESRAPEVDFDALDAVPDLRFASRREFANEVFYSVAFSQRGLVVGFNLPFDLSRIAFAAGRTRRSAPRGRRDERRSTRRHDSYAGGFSLALFDYRDPTGVWREKTRYRPRVAIKTLDSKRHLIGFRRPEELDVVDQIPDDARKPDPAFRVRGNFLDLRTLAFALTDEGHSLESASEAFGVPYRKREVEHGHVTPELIDYCREDVAATASLCERTLAEFLRNPIELKPTSAYSPATIGRAYLRALGVQPPLEREPDFPREVLGYAMSAYYGGRAEARIRKVPVPVSYVDFASMYPTVCSLMGLWRFLTAERVDVLDADDQVETLLKEVDLERCFDPSLWPSLASIAQVAPEGDVLPTRARYGASESWQIGVTPLTSSEPLWYPLADLLTSKLLTGKAPRVLRSFRFAPKGRQKSLRGASLLGALEFDPRRGDFFRALVEERRRAALRLKLPQAERDWREKGLKVLGNSTSYGIYAQMVRHELPKKEREPVNVYALGEPFVAPVSAPEEAGAFCFPPLAACITGAARLMLALLERLVTDVGGSYAFCDTDSMAIVATREGGLVPCPGGRERTDDGKEALRALSWGEVEEIRNKFAALNPYHPEAVPGSILELEDENFADPNTRRNRRELWCYAVSAKRYALYHTDNKGELALRKASEHGLGHLLNPIDPQLEERDWIQEAWEHRLRSDLGLEAEEPSWLDRPAIGRTTMSTPNQLDLFKGLDGGKRYEERLKPFNFLNIAFVPPLERPPGTERMVLVSPYERDPARWLETTWYDRYSGDPYRIRAEPSNGAVTAGTVSVKRYRDVLNQYWGHPEDKSLGADGKACGRRTRGLLGRRTVIAISRPHLIGKESNRLEEVQEGLVQDLGETLIEYDDSRVDLFRLHVVPVLKEMPRARLAEAVGMSKRRVIDVCTGKAHPRRDHKAAFLRAAGERARAELRARGLSAPQDDVVACALYLRRKQVG